MHNRMGRMALAAALTLALATGLGGCAHSLALGQSAEPGQTKAASLYTDLAGEYMRMGDMERARDKVRMALEQDPDYGPAYGMRALLYMHQQRYDEADKAFSKALSLDGDDSETRNNYASFLCRQGQADKAMREFAQVLKDPAYDTRDVALTNAGICALQLPDRARAEDFFRRALQLDPKYGPALAQMAILSYTKGELLSTRAFVQRYEAVSVPGRDLLMIGLHTERKLGDRKAVEHYREQLNQRFPNIDTH